MNIISMIDSFKNKNILDIGCGEGNLCAMMQMGGGIVTGIDYSSEAIEIAKVFGSDKSGAFINGVIDSFVQNDKI